jgi:hypothetical protein
MSSGIVGRPAAALVLARSGCLASAGTVGRGALAGVVLAIRAGGGRAPDGESLVLTRLQVSEIGVVLLMPLLTSGSEPGLGGTVVLRSDAAGPTTMPGSGVAPVAQPPVRELVAEDRQLRSRWCEYCEGHMLPAACPAARTRDCMRRARHVVVSVGAQPAESICAVMG